MKEEEAVDHRPRTVLNTSESQSFNYVQGKTDTETNYEICLGVHFALCVNKYIKQYASKRTVSLVNYWYTRTHACARTHTLFFILTHTHTHTHTHRCAHCMDAWTPIEMFENGFIFNRTLKHHNFWKFYWTHGLWSLTKQDLSGGFALSFKIDGHFVFESTRKAYKSWVKFRNTISWKYLGSIPSQLLKVCIVHFNWIAILFDSKRKCERDEQKKKERISFRQFVIETIFFSTHCRKHSAGVYLDTNQWTAWTISGHTLPQHSADSFKCLMMPLSGLETSSLFEKASSVSVSFSVPPRFWLHKTIVREQSTGFFNGSCSHGSWPFTVATKLAGTCCRIHSASQPL